MSPHDRGVGGGDGIPGDKEDQDERGFGDHGLVVAAFGRGVFDGLVGDVQMV